MNPRWRRWIERFLPSFGRRRGEAIRRPTREEIARLPPFHALDLNHIMEVDTPEAAERAVQELSRAGVVGFDTESRPTFRKGEVSRGPHVVQFATTERAYVFILHDRECRKAAGELIASDALKKVGFGLGDDLIRIRRKLGVESRDVLDLETLFARKGFGRGVGVKAGLALVLKCRFSKSKKAATSNWERHRLSDAQLLYAANDSYAALCAYHALMKL